MKSLIALIIAITTISKADTFNLTNGVPITGSVVSSSVAQVWIKTTLGQVINLPVSSFDSVSCRKFPDDISDVYRRLFNSRQNTQDALDTAQSAVDKYCELDSITKKSMAETAISMDASLKRMQILFAELAAWREANVIGNATPEQRQQFVDKKVGEASSEVLASSDKEPSK